MRSIEDIEDRVIKMATTLCAKTDRNRRLGGFDHYYRRNGKLHPDIKRQLYALVERASELKEKTNE